ncbi:UDP-3-O-acyl-N-acetylglucosamine deacetylase [Turicimonas muris]|uniref:UDP-3-O-acyl-N-acetylglucosamine deacetylase n=4 Tax=Turicimonas muris TaxID=1796652 RepID=UPI00080F350C|nr:UDP-3-O-acyl-N-acetylglucosamine deacetylase [Turicimonas muris]MBS4767389.1 UDP-3-O-acyl-N-acetylglucosamine deacetylase [Burkholderiales bacterium]QQQ95905.1 UDP-3-O-acyl-N-acetylglucosamine deacetylase [Turicimonas muris]
MIRQRTIKKAFETVGIGLHSGRKVKLALRPAPVDTGIVFRRIDLNPPVAIKAEPERVNDTRMATTLDKGQAKIATIEHLMSALSGLGIDNCYVEVDGAEVPIMDGSGASFVFLIKAAGVEEQDAPRKFVRVKKSIEIHAGDKWASLEPFNGYKLSFAIDFGHPAIDATAQFVEVDFDNHTYINDVAKARTFGFVNDLEMLRSYGLAQGGTLDNAVVMDDYHVLNPDGLRSNDEFAKHKLLDAMGDLYVLGHPLVAHYKAFKSGHDLNNKLLRKLLSEPDSWEFVTFEDSSKAPSAFTNALVIPSI